MTRSKEYQAADPFKRYLLRQLYAGKWLIKRGWYKHQEGSKDIVELPLDIHTLECIKDAYDKILAGKRPRRSRNPQ